VSVLPQTVYRRSIDPGDLPKELRLRALEWALYFAVAGNRTAAELARHVRAEPAESDAAFARLLGLGMIEEQELAAAEYVVALAAAGDREDKTLHEFLSGALEAPPAAATPSPPRLTLAEAPPPKRAPLRPPRAPQPPFGFKPLPPSIAEAKESRMMPRPRRLSLRALMNVIERHSGGRESGQLDIYRVFVRVDTALLKRNGIETLKFTEDRLVSDPELEQAIVRSVKKTLGLDCPESVWVDVA
jgi:hypothetical protein